MTKSDEKLHEAWAKSLLKKDNKMAEKHVLLNKLRTTNEELQKINQIFVEDIIRDLTSPEHLLVRNHRTTLYELASALERQTSRIRKWLEERKDK